MKENKKNITINNAALAELQHTRRRLLVMGIVYLVASVIFALLARVLREHTVILWWMFLIIFGVFALCSAHQFLCCVLMQTKPLKYKHSQNKVNNGDIAKSLFSIGKILHQQDGKIVVKTTLLNNKIIIGCFDITEDDRHSDFSNDILLARKIEKQRRNVGYAIIFNVKCSNFDVQKFMKQQSLDNYALCDLRCFYFAEDQELITVYDKKGEFCKQITEQLVRLLNSLETVGVIGDKDNQQ